MSEITIERDFQECVDECISDVFDHTCYKCNQKIKCRDRDLTKKYNMLTLTPNGDIGHSWNVCSSCNVTIVQKNNKWVHVCSRCCHT